MLMTMTGTQRERVIVVGDETVHRCTLGVDYETEG
jgi:hypothetical protein